VKLQNFTKFYSIRMCLMLLHSVHNLKCETNLTLIHVNAFHNGNVLGPISESLPLNFIMHLCSSLAFTLYRFVDISVSFVVHIKVCQIPQPLQNEKASCYLCQILLLTLLVAVKWFQIIYCRIGWQLTSDETWNTELKNSMSGSNIMKILIFYLPAM